MDGVRVRVRVRARGRGRGRGRGRDRRPKTHRSGMIRPMGGCEGIRSSRSSTTAQPYMPPQRVRVDQRRRKIASRMREEVGWWDDVTMSCMQCLS